MEGGGTAEEKASLLTLELILLDLSWIRVPKLDTDHKIVPTVCFKVLDFPLVMFTPAQRPSEVRPQTSITYNQGKSCVFSSAMNSLSEQFRTYPIYSFLMDTAQQPAPMIAFGAFPLHAVLVDITQFSQDSNANWPTISAQHGEAYLRNTRGKRVAWISFALRLSCLSDGAPLPTATMKVRRSATQGPVLPGELSGSAPTDTDSDGENLRQVRQQSTVDAGAVRRAPEMYDKVRRGDDGVRVATPAAQTTATYVSHARHSQMSATRTSPLEDVVTHLLPTNPINNRRYSSEPTNRVLHKEVAHRSDAFPGGTAKDNAFPAHHLHKAGEPHQQRQRPVVMLAQQWELDPSQLTPLPPQHRPSGDHVTGAPTPVTRKVAQRPQSGCAGAPAAAAKAPVQASAGSWSPPRASASASSLGAGGGDATPLVPEGGSCWQAPLEGCSEDDCSVSGASSGPIVTRLIQELAAMQRAGAEIKDAACQTKPLEELISQYMQMRGPAQAVKLRRMRSGRSKMRTRARRMALPPAAAGGRGPSRPPRAAARSAGVTKPLSVISEERVTLGFARRRVLPCVPMHGQLPDTTAVDRLARGQPVSVRRAAPAASRNAMSPVRRLRPVTLTRTAQLRLAKHMPDVRHDLQAQEYSRRRDRWLVAQRTKLERSGKQKRLSPHRVGEALQNDELLHQATPLILPEDGPSTQQSARSRSRRSARQSARRLNVEASNPPPARLNSIGIQADSRPEERPTSPAPLSGRAGPHLSRRSSKSARSHRVSIDSRSPPSSYSEPRLSYHCTRSPSRQPSPLARVLETKDYDAPHNIPNAATTAEATQISTIVRSQDIQALPLQDCVVTPIEDLSSSSINNISTLNGTKKSQKCVSAGAVLDPADATATTPPLKNVQESSYTTNNQQPSSIPMEESSAKSPVASNSHTSNNKEIANAAQGPGESPAPAEVSDQVVSSGTTSVAESVQAEVDSKATTETVSKTATFDSESNSKSAAGDVQAIVTTSTTGSSESGETSESSSSDSGTASATSDTLSHPVSDLSKNLLSEGAIPAKTGSKRDRKKDDVYYTASNSKERPRDVQLESNQEKQISRSRRRAVPSLSPEVRRDSGSGVVSRPPTLSAAPDSRATRSRSHSRDSEEIEARIAMYLEQTRQKEAQQAAAAAKVEAAPVAAVGSSWLKGTTSAQAGATHVSSPGAVASSWLKAWKVDEEARPARSRHTLTANKSNDLNTDSVSSYVPSDMDALMLSDISPP